MRKDDFAIFQLGVYCDAIMVLLKTGQPLTVMKTAFFAYALNKERYSLKSVFDMKTKTDILEKQISIINGDFDGFNQALPYILKAINALVNAGIIRVESDNLFLEKEVFVSQYFSVSPFFLRAIEESVRWSDKRFLKELLHNV